MGRIEWTRLEFDEIVWKYTTDKIGWDSELLVKANQAAAIFTKGSKLSRKLTMHDYFGEEDRYRIAPDSLPLTLRANPDLIETRYLHAYVIFCNTKEKLFKQKVYAGEAYGQAVVGCEANATCRFRIYDPKLFLGTFVTRNKTNDASLVKYISRTLGLELFRRYRPYDWDTHEYIGIEDWRDLGIEMISLQFENYKQHSGAVGV